MHAAEWIQRCNKHELLVFELFDEFLPKFEYKYGLRWSWSQEPEANFYSMTNAIADSQESYKIQLQEAIKKEREKDGSV